MSTRRWIGLTMAFCVLTLVVSPAHAWTNYNTSGLRFGTYPDYGFYFWSNGDPYPETWISSNRCKSYEAGAWSRIKSSTYNKSDGFGTRWEYLDFFKYRCDGGENDSVDIRLRYLPGGTSSSGKWCQTNHCGGSYGGNYAGENHQELAPKSWCEIWGLTSSKCGQHIPVVHLNEERIDNYDNKALKERALIHETGHSIGFKDYCPGDSYNGIMENGKSSCNNNGNWKDTNYTAFDRDGVYDIYPNWPYHD